MEQEIHFTNNDFDFTQLSISQPISVQGGGYFTKIKMKNDTLYVELPKCTTKQGLNETNKKTYIDLMFPNDNECVIEWFENLENKLIELIYQKKDIWFQNEMEKEDIETFFNPICRPFKGGKFHLIRINIPRNKTLSSQYHCNIYDENENIIPITDLNDKHSIIPVLEIQGIKFSSRNFHLEILGKQIMILSNKPLFNDCVIKRKNVEKSVQPIAQPIAQPITQPIAQPIAQPIDQPITQPIAQPIDQPITQQLRQLKEDTPLQDNTTKYNTSLGDNTKKNVFPENNRKLSVQESIINTLADDNDNHIDNDISKNYTKQTDMNKYLETSKENLEKKTTQVISFDLEDITTQLPIVKNESKLKLKNPNEVYYQIYKIAKSKAKQHKKSAISHYLEATKIKNTYLLDDLDNSDSSDEEYIETVKVKNEINKIVRELA
jgi:hypothetical protein